MNQVEQADEQLQICTFEVGGGNYAVDVLDVREVNAETIITPVSHAPHGVRGLVNVRGQVFLIFDVGLLMGLGRTEIGEASRLILFKERVGPTFGILVDRIGDIVYFPMSKIVTRRRKESGANRDDERGPDGHLEGLIRGICKFENELMALLQPRRLIELSEPHGSGK